MALSTRESAGQTEAILHVNVKSYPNLDEGKREVKAKLDEATGWEDKMIFWAQAELQKASGKAL